MSKTYSAGIVTAYGAAKRAGYQGTYEDFCRQQAGYAESAAAVEQAKNTAVSAASTATAKATAADTSATAAQTAKTQTEAAASQALTDIGTARSGAISAVQTEGQTQTVNARAQAQAAAQSATTASTKASEASASATSAGQSATNAAASAASAANAASAAQGVLESIPEDYSDLSKDVDKLKADLGDVVNEATLSMPESFKSANYSTTYRKIKYDSGKKALMVSVDATTVSDGGTLGMNCSLSAGSTLPLNSSNVFDVSQTDDTLLVVDVYYPKLCAGANSKLRLNFYNSEELEGGSTFNAVYPFDEGIYTLVINVSKVVRDTKAQSSWSYYDKVYIHSIQGSTVTFNSDDGNGRVLRVYIMGTISKTTYGYGLNTVERVKSIGETATQNKENIQTLDTRVLVLENAPEPGKDFVFHDEALAYRDALPSYYTTQPENPASFSDDSYIDDKIRGIPEGHKFIFFLDEHWETSTKKIIPLISYVRRRTGAHNVLFGGDYLDRENTKYIANQVFSDFVTRCIAEWGFNFLPVIGNHDSNLANALGNKTDEQLEEMYYPPSQWQNVIFSGVKNTVHPDYDEKIRTFTSDSTVISELKEYFKTCYYYDDPSIGTRFIVLNTGNPEYGYVYDTLGASNFYELWLQFEFLYSALLSTPAMYNVVLVGHWFIVNGNPPASMYKYPNYAARMLSALKTKSSLTISMDYAGIADTPQAELLERWMSAGSKTWDFTEANTVGKVIMLSGHVHSDAMVKGYPSGSSWANSSLMTGSTVHESTGEIPCVMTHTDCFYRSENRMTENSVEEQAFDVVTFTDEAIVMSRIGYGTDRIIYVD